MQAHGACRIQEHEERMRWMASLPVCAHPPGHPPGYCTRPQALDLPWILSEMGQSQPLLYRRRVGRRQVGMKTLMALLDCCLLTTWSMPHPCGKEPVFYATLMILVLAIVATVLWLKIVYTRYETTTAMPVEYGTLHLGVLLGGIIFYQEHRIMEAWQFVSASVGLTVVLIGVYISSRTSLPGCFKVLIVGMPFVPAKVLPAHADTTR